MSIVSLFFYSIFFPSVGVIWINSTDSFFDDPVDTVFCFGPFAFYWTTTLAAAYLAHKKNFHKYNLSTSYNAWTTFWGCLFFWSLYFPSFVRNYVLVSKGKAKEGAEGYGNMLLAFAWSVFWVVCFAMYHSSFIPSRQWVNSRAALESLRKYHSAQLAFRDRQLAGIAGNTKNQGGFCDDFRVLHYGLDREHKQLALIPKNIADAFAPTENEEGSAGPPSVSPAPHMGYVFHDDPYIAENKLWPTQFGLVAYPQRPGITGDSIWWIGMEGELRYLPLPREAGAFTLLTPGQSPSNPHCEAAWQEW